MAALGELIGEQKGIGGIGGGLLGGILGGDKSF